MKKKVTKKLDLKKLKVLKLADIAQVKGGDSSGCPFVSAVCTKPPAC